MTKALIIATVIATAGAAGAAGASCAAAADAPKSAPKSAPAQPSAPAAKPSRAALDAGFARWIEGFKKQALAAGIGAKTLAAAFAGVRLNRKVIKYNAYQPEFVQPVGVYVAARTTPETIAKGRTLGKKHAALFAKVQAEYGVAPEYILAIWRLETAYGVHFGSFNVIEALATLAYASRRGGFWRQQLIAALKIADRGFVPLKRLRGSWAGAMGHTQFIPTTYLARAVDFDGDGKRDLWGSLPDVFASTANYLKRAGWQTGLPFGLEVRLPAGFDYASAHAAVRRPVKAWRAAGVTLADGKPLPDIAGPTSIVVPSGHVGPAFLVTANYTAILRYNNAAAYALTVGILAERIAGRGTVRRPWPNRDRLLNRGQKEELQRLLARLGFDPGPVDGKVGPSTQAAIRRFQARVRVPADGYANQALLERVRAKASVRQDETKTNKDEKKQKPTSAKR